jgi:hypothetical protein
LRRHPEMQRRLPLLVVAETLLEPFDLAQHCSSPCIQIQYQ